jgi:hypothetical protein
MMGGSAGFHADQAAKRTSGQMTRFSACFKEKGPLRLM